MRTLDWISWILVIIGGLNWLLIGLFSWNILGAIFGTGVLAHIIYILVGLSALYQIIFFKGIKHRCVMHK